MSRFKAYLLTVLVALVAGACTGWESSDYTAVINALAGMWKELGITAGALYMLWLQFQTKKRLEENTVETKATRADVQVGNEVTKSVGVASGMSHDDVQAVEAVAREAVAAKAPVAPKG